MSVYDPPSEITPIFNPVFWETNDINLTKTEADDLYLSIYGGQIIPLTESFAGGIEVNTIEPYGTASTVLNFQTTGQTNFSGNVNVPTGSNYKINNVDLIASQTGQSGKYLSTDGTSTTWATVDSLPSQTGNAGKYLGTDGTTASWDTVDSLPSQTGNSGKYLSTDGTVASWQTVSSTTPPGGSSTQIQYNDAGVFGGSSGLTFDKLTDQLTVNNLFVNGSLLSDTLTTAGIYAGVVGTNYRIKLLNTGSTGEDVSSIDFGNTDSLTAYRGRIQYNNNEHSIRMYTNGTQRVVIDGFGQVGLGITNNPSYTVDCGGDCNLRTGFQYRINGTSVLNSTTLGSGVTASSLTSVGTLSSLTTSGSGTTDLAYVNSGRRVEIGSSSNTSYIDFHSFENSTSDYDTRIVSTSGNATTFGQGTLSYNALRHNFGASNVTFGNSTTQPRLSLIDENSDTKTFYDGKFLKFPSINNRPCIAPIRGTIFSGTTFDVALSDNYNQNGTLLVSIIGGASNWAFATGINLPYITAAPVFTTTGTIPTITSFRSENINYIRFGSLGNYSNWKFCIWIMTMDGDIFD